MILTKSVVEQVGKVFLNLGQGVMLGGFLASFIENKITFVQSAVCFFIGAMTVVVGLYFLSELKNVRE